LPCFLCQFQHWHKQAVQFQKEPAQEGGQGVVIRMAGGAAASLISLFQLTGIQPFDLLDNKARQMIFRQREGRPALPAVLRTGMIST